MIYKWNGSASFLITKNIMQRDLHTTEELTNTLDLPQEGCTTTQEVKISDIDNSSLEASPTPKHRQNQVHKAISKEVTRDENDHVKVYTDFDQMGLSDGLLRGIYAYGFEKPSAVQQRAIVPCVAGRDVVAQAQSGTGKTATFSISLLQQIDMSKKTCQVSN